MPGSDAPLASIRWRPFRLPLRHRFEAAHAALADRAGVLLELVAADSYAGIGEASPLPSLGGGTADEVLALLGRHADALLAAPASAHEVFPTEASGAAALRCALDVALLDLEARRAGVSVARLLAASPVSEVKANAVIGAGTPDGVAAAGLEAVEAGYRVLKLKVGAG